VLLQPKSTSLHRVSASGLDLVPSSIRPRDDLEQVPAGILEIDAASAEVGVDGALLPLARISPVVEASRLDPVEDLLASSRR
jgi:hypothetical protein